MAGVQLAYEISKDAMKLVKAGKAVISSGGVRLPNGTLVELAKPIAQSVGSGPLSPLTFVSSITNNVQSVFIQKSVNKANRGITDLKKQGVEILSDLDVIHADTLELKNGMIAVLDELHDVNVGMRDVKNGIYNVNHVVNLLNAKADYNLLQMNQLQNMVSSLGAITWLSCAFGILNSGISIVGFTQVLSRLSGISEQIAALDQKIDRNLMNDYRQQFEKYYNQIRTDMQSLQNLELKASEMYFIPNHLNEISPFLDRISIEFMAGNINNELACNIIFGLTNAYAQLIQFYSARYLYEKGELPASYDSWINTIANISQREFQSRLETALTLEYMDLPYKQQKDILDATLLNSRLQLDNMIFSNMLTDVLPEKDYLNFDQYLIELSSSAENLYETEDRALLMIA